MNTLATAVTRDQTLRLTSGVAGLGAQTLGADGHDRGLLNRDRNINIGLFMIYNDGGNKKYFESTMTE